MPPTTRTTELEREVERLRAIVAKAIEVVESDALAGVTQMAAVHGMIYDGPVFDCDAARAALEQGHVGTWLCTKCTRSNVNLQKKCGHCGLTRQPEAAPAQTDAPAADGPYDMLKDAARITRDTIAELERARVVDPRDLDTPMDASLGDKSVSRKMLAAKPTARDVPSAEDLRGVVDLLRAAAELKGLPNAAARVADYLQRLAAEHKR